jgi:hypothetical protein
LPASSTTVRRFFAESTAASGAAGVAHHLPQRAEPEIARLVGVDLALGLGGVDRIERPVLRRQHAGLLRELARLLAEGKGGLEVLPVRGGGIRLRSGEPGDVREHLAAEHPEQLGHVGRLRSGRRGLDLHQWRREGRGGRRFRLRAPRPGADRLDRGRLVEGRLLPPPEPGVVDPLARVAGTHDGLGEDALGRQADPRRRHRRRRRVVAEQPGRVGLRGFLLVRVGHPDQRVEPDTRRHREHQRVADDADQPVLHDLRDGPAAAVGREEAVEQEVAAVRVHRPPDGMVVILEIRVQVADQPGGQPPVVVRRAAAFPGVQGRKIGVADKVSAPRWATKAGVVADLDAGRCANCPSRTL